MKTLALLWLIFHIVIFPIMMMGALILNLSNPVFQHYMEIQVFFCVIFVSGAALFAALAPSTIRDFNSVWYRK